MNTNMYMLSIYKTGYRKVKNKVYDKTLSQRQTH